MSLQIVEYDDLDFEDWHSVSGALYNGEKFTGIALSQDDTTLAQYEFKNGKHHGRHFCINKADSFLHSEEFYDNGICIGKHRQVIRDGTVYLTHYTDGKMSFKEIINKDGILLTEYDKKNNHLKFWHANRQLFTEKHFREPDNIYTFKFEKYWFEDGTWLMTRNDEEFSFNEDFISDNLGLLDYTYEKVIDGYCNYLVKREAFKALNFFHKLTLHTVPFYRHDACRHLFTLSFPDSMPFLEKLLDDTIKPYTGVISDWNGGGRSTTAGESIAERAKRTIEEIKKRNKIN